MILILFPEELEAITANIITCKQKIDEVIPVTAPSASVPPSLMAPVMVPPSVTVVKPRLPRLQLPRRCQELIIILGFLQVCCSQKW